MSIETDKKPAVVTVTDRSFDEDVLGAKTPVLVDFWAPWCGPCRAVAPVVEALAEEFAGRGQVAKLNVDENPAAAARYGIASLPTLLVFKGGRVVDQIIGAASPLRIGDRFEAHLA